ITANSNQAKVYGNADPSAYTYALQANSAGQGLVGTDTFTGALTRATGENVGSYAIAQGSLANSNYAITYVPANFAVTARPITITANSNQTKVYGNADPSAYTYTLEANTSGRGVVGADTFTGNLTRATGENVGSYAIAQGNLANSNYAITYVPANFAVTARPITITANSNQTKVYGDLDPALLGYTTENSSLGRGLVSGDNFTGSLTRASGENVGSYTIGQGSLANSNYAINFAPKSFVITPANLTLTGSREYDGTIVINGAAMQANGVNGERFTVAGQANLSTKNVVFDANNSNLVTYQQLLEVSGLALTGVSGAQLSNYRPLATTNTRVTINQRAVTLTAPSISKVYDGLASYNMTAGDLTAMSGLLAGGDTVTSASVAFSLAKDAYGNDILRSDANVGSNKVVKLLSAVINDGNNGKNYNKSLVTSATSEITPAPLTVTAVNSAKFVTEADVHNYDGAIYNGFVGVESVANLNGALAISRSNSGSNAAGTYTLTPDGFGASGAVNGNYKVSYQTGNFIIVPANQLLVQVNPASTTYGGTADYLATARYLKCSMSDCNASGSVNTITSLTPVINGTSVNVNDGVGGAASFTIAPALAKKTGSNQYAIGGYNLSAADPVITGANFNSMVLTGGLTINRLSLLTSQLGISGTQKVYDGNAAIAGLTLQSSVASSSILNGDKVTIGGNGYFDDQHVGTGKTVTLNISLGGDDANNYTLSNSQFTNNTGTITQLASVTYVGATGGNWSNGGNWAGGALPNRNNVAQVIIPTGITVNYDSALVGRIGSTISNSGNILFNGSNAFEFNNNLTGSGTITQSGAGALTVSGDNSAMTGNTLLSSGAQLIIGSANALGSGAVTSAGGLLGVANNVVLNSLTVSGPVTLTSDIATSGTQTYGGVVTLGSGYAVSGALKPMLLNSSNGNIVFNGALVAGASSLTNKQSLNISAPRGQIIFGDRVGANIVDASGQLSTYNAAYLTSPNIFNLDVAANSILIKGNITTFGNQTYIGHVLIGDNGSNGLTRILLSEDPSITFKGQVDDAQANTHNLVVAAIAIDPTQDQAVTFNGAVGSVAPLASLTVRTGVQNQEANALIAAISTNPNNYSGVVNILSDVTTSGNQNYTANTIGLGSSALGSTPQAFTTNGGVISFNVGTTGNNLISNGSVPINVTLGGGSINGFSTAGVAYKVTDLVVPVPPVVAPPAVTQPPVAVAEEQPAPVLASLPRRDEGIATGSLMAALNKRDVEYVLSNGKGASGSVSVTSPDAECRGDDESCLNAKPL
ncbi:MBG domain-containing protein, partial [Polynucleobacter sp. MWH-Adler-W8]|uniref:beta strand repeat-containing protein n=1 Tax=Polynucleobacter sp. MWH-Adler-W8 TaxID=1819727 RepID=UPI00192D072D